MKTRICLKYFVIILATQFQLKLKILIFSTKYVQKVYLWSNMTESEHHHCNLFIQISLGTKFWTKFAQKGFLLSTAERVNTTIEF